MKIVCLALLLALVACGTDSTTPVDASVQADADPWSICSCQPGELCLLTLGGGGRPMAPPSCLRGPQASQCATCSADCERTLCPPGFEDAGSPYRCRTDSTASTPTIICAGQ